MATETQNLLNPLRSSKEQVTHYNDHKTLLQKGVHPATAACELMRQREITHPVHIPDLVKLVKDQYRYIPLSDASQNSLQHAQPLETTVQSRTLHQFGYLSQQDHTWEKKYAHYQKVLQSGHFSFNQEPYETLGNVVTDPRSLFLHHFDEDISLQLMEKLALRHQTATKRLEVSDETTNNKPDLCDFVEREKECSDAGLGNINQLLAETNTRIVATRAGQSYLKHVQQCQALKDEKKKLNSKTKDDGKMVVQELSHTDIMHGDAIRIATIHNSQKDENEDGTDPTKNKKYCRHAIFEWKKMTKRNKVLHKLQYIYHILCSLYNLRGRYLKSKNALTNDMVFGLRRNPFMRKQEDCKVRSSRGGAHTSMSMESRLDIKGTASIRHSELGRERSSLYPNIAASGASKNTSVNSRKTSQEPALNVQNVISRARKNSIFGGPPASLLPPNAGAKSSLRPNRLMTLVASQDIQSKVETWEDLLNVGHRTKILKLLRKHVPPWQIPMTNYEPVKSTKKKDKKHMNQYHSEEAVHTMRSSYLALKERVLKNQKHDLEKVDRERVIKFRYKLHTMQELEPLYEIQKEILKQVSREAVRDPALITEETIPWYDSLIQETIQMGCRQDPDVCDYLGKIEKFLLEEVANIPSVKEKLCLITVSLPIKEICTAHVQHAIQFVLIEILDGNIQMLEDWQNYRKLYVIKM